MSFGGCGITSGNDLASLRLIAARPETERRVDRSEIVGALREIAARLRLAGDNPFRARAYAAGADAVERMADAELERRLLQGTLTDVEGIGGALAAAIAQLARTGHVELLDRLRTAAPAALLELTRLRGVTKRRARLLHDALGVANIDELAAAARAGRVRDVKGFGPKTEAAILEAIAAYRQRPIAMRLVDARDAALGLAAFVAGCRGVESADVTGGVRGWQEVVDELAVLAVADPPTGPAVDAVANYPPLARVEQWTEDRVIARLADGVRVNVRLAAPHRRGVALIEETGPPAHVRDLQARAAELRVDWSRLSAPDERSVYGALALPFVPVEARGWSPLPPPADLDDLVTEADLAGGVHCHTRYSDGRNTIEEMARAADARGLHYLTITDHSPTAAYAGGLSLDRLREQWDEIARVQEAVKVRLLRGTESDILADGALDYPDSVLERFDVIIASIHARYRMDAEAMTARLVRAMRLPVFKVWGHALGRLLLRRDPIACDVEAVLDAVASARAAVEISGDPYRLDLPPAWIPAARRRGIRFVISTDAHAIADLDNVVYGVAMARRGGVRRAEVLNALPFAQFRSAVHP
jgi:DNA polymerase (family 10)